MMKALESIVDATGIIGAICLLVTFIFAILNAFGAIDVSWTLVLLPVFGYFGLLVLLAIVFAVIIIMLR